MLCPSNAHGESNQAKLTTRRRSLFHPCRPHLRPRQHTTMSQFCNPPARPCAFLPPHPGAHTPQLEIAAFLQSVYGMNVERVSTINYLGRRRLAISRNGKRLWWREDDWKKAYVIFRPPAGQEHLLTRGRRAGGDGDSGDEEQQRPVIEQIREAARAPRLPPRPYPWERRPGGGRRGAPGGEAEVPGGRSGDAAE